MATDRFAPHPDETMTAAQDSTRPGPVPDWVKLFSFPDEPGPRTSADVTHLLLDRQVQAERGETCFHVALRLETTQGVQNNSPWRLDFEPRRQQVTLHWIRTWRGGVSSAPAPWSAARVVDCQAEGSPEHDRSTLLLMLEDVRPGDVLEWCYTVKTNPLLLPGWAGEFFALPTGVPVARFHFSVLFDPARPMRWKSSAPEWQPVEEQESGLTLWSWTHDQYRGLPREENAPDWLIPYDWIQISDCSDWAVVAAAFTAAWPEPEPEDTLAEIARDLAAADGDISEKVERAIQMVQDDYRYLAADWELDGTPPAAPGVVARRRYGDCKDLAQLLVCLLQRLGVPARPVLVNTILRQSLGGLLPAPGLFNHVLVEYEMGGERKWADAAFKRDGGFSAHRAARTCGVGLPLGGSSAGLAGAPTETARTSALDLNESILLDMSGGWSWLGVVLAARGSHAEELRAELESDGAEAFAEKRRRQCTVRFGHAKRLGALEYRDDRAANEFFLAEIFEVRGFFAPGPKPKTYRIDLANEYTVNFLKLPEEGTRRTPFALPFPCNIVHTIELHAVSLPPATVYQQTTETNFLHATRSRKTLAGYWSMKLTLSTLANALPPESVAEHRKAVEGIRKQSVWSIVMPGGEPRPHQRSDFGKLPAAWNPAFFVPQPAQVRPSTASPAQLAPGPLPVEDPVSPGTPAAPKRRRKHRHRAKTRRRGRGEAPPKWQIAGVCALALTLILIVFFVARNADRWGIFRNRPAAPSGAVTPSSP